MTVPSLSEAELIEIENRAASLSEDRVIPTDLARRIGEDACDNIIDWLGALNDVTFVQRDIALLVDYVRRSRERGE
jgi:hypothetical protein